MKKSTQHILEDILRSDPTCDNALIGPTVDVAKGKTAQHIPLDDMDRVMCRAAVAERLGVTPRWVSELAKRGELKRIQGTGDRCYGYSARSVRAYLERSLA